MPKICVPFYLAEDCKHLPLETRLHEIIKRKQRFLVNGKQFKLPRRLVYSIFYRRIGGEKAGFARGWTYRVFYDFLRTNKVIRSLSRYKVQYIPRGIYSKALAFERELYSSRSLTKLREGAVRHPDKSIALLAAFDCAVENSSLENREYIKQKSYCESLTKSKDQQ